jgi:exopolysaccharide production protein ExoZ
LNYFARQFESSRGGNANNVQSMEGLRGFAVFLVFIVHFVALVKPWISNDSTFSTIAQSLHTIGNTGVDLFFVLSGYLIYGSLISRKQGYLRFMSRRLQRIYPAFIVVFAVYVVSSFIFPAESKLPISVSDKIVYLVQNFFLLPGLFPIEPMITVAWSLSYEMFYYLLIPLVIGAFGLRHRSVVWRIAFFLSITLAIVVYCFVNGGHVRLIMFIAGIVLYEVMNNTQAPSPSGSIGVTALVLGLLATLFPVAGSGAYSLKICILFVSFSTLCWACFRRPSARLARSFSWTPLRWLGNMSYSYFLLHGLTLKAAFMAFGNIVPPAVHGQWIFWVLLPPMFILTLIPTAALFIFVERPFSLRPHRPQKTFATPSVVESPLKKTIFESRGRTDA